MHHAVHRNARACVLALLAFARPGLADEPKITAAMQCEAAVEPGRVKCSAEVRTAGGRSIAWADLEIVELPEHASALKGRIGPSDAIAREATIQKWAFGLVARKAGRGEVKGRVRAVVCEPSATDAAPRCAPATLDVKTTIQVG
jgi:hypothetical protein